MRVQPRERFSLEVALTPAMVAEHARAVGDTNPIHHDPEFAASSRYGRLIASGTHTTALLLGLTASHFSKKGSMAGLEFWVRFRRPVFADERVKLEWLVVKVTPNTKLKGEVVELRGRIRAANGETAVGARDESWSQSSSDHRFLFSMTPNQLIGAGHFGGFAHVRGLLMGVLGVLEIAWERRVSQRLMRPELNNLVVSTVSEEKRV